MILRVINRKDILNNNNKHMIAYKGLKLGQWNLNQVLCQPPKFRPSYQAFYDEHEDHMSYQNLMECFTTSTDIEIYLNEQDQTLTHRI